MLQLLLFSNDCLYLTKERTSFWQWRDANDAAGDASTGVTSWIAACAKVVLWLVNLPTWTQSAPGVQSGQSTLQSIVVLPSDSKHAASSTPSKLSTWPIVENCYSQQQHDQWCHRDWRALMKCNHHWTRSQLFRHFLLRYCPGHRNVCTNRNLV